MEVFKVIASIKGRNNGQEEEIEELMEKMKMEIYAFLLMLGICFPPRLSITPILISPQFLILSSGIHIERFSHGISTYIHSSGNSPPTAPTGFFFSSSSSCEGIEVRT